MSNTCKNCGAFILPNYLSSTNSSLRMQKLESRNKLLERVLEASETLISESPIVFSDTANELKEAISAARATNDQD